MNESRPANTQTARVRRLRSELARLAGKRLSRVRVVRSPYRVCPLGAHVDHQGGAVTGLAVDRALLAAFMPRHDRWVSVRSRQFEGAVRFSLDHVPERPAGDWADYARGACHALLGTHSLERGVDLLVDGYTNVGGLSSSAAVGVAYLLALEAANGLDLTAKENTELDRRIENDYIGLNNGILDQSTILLSRCGHLMHLNCATGRSRLVPYGGERAFCIAVLFSGLRTPLAQTGYNERVAQCRRAAGMLARRAGLAVGDALTLGEVPADVFEEYGDSLPPDLRKRARHFFTEQERVRRGVRAWRRGDVEELGRLVTESGRSSVVNYECGNPYLRSAFEALRDAEGVYGARFSGAGFRGCCIGLAEPAARESIAKEALARYLEAHEEMAGKAEVYFCSSADGAGRLE